MNPLWYEADQVQDVYFDAVIVGSGPAGVAAAEFLYEKHPGWRICVLERGGLLTTTHVNNLFPGQDRRQEFITTHEKRLWLGDWENRAIVPTFGGRGVVSGTHMRRFDPDDMHLWGDWPVSLDELDPYYTKAEVVRQVQSEDCRGVAQTWLMQSLSRYRAAPPPWSIKDGHTDSPAERLWRLMHDSQLHKRHLTVVLHARAKQLYETGCWNIRYQDTRGYREYMLYAKRVLLAASAVESADLVLRSHLVNSNVGCYLSEHAYARMQVNIPVAQLGQVDKERVNIIVPPQSADRLHRYQIELRGEVDDQTLKIRMQGVAALEPFSENCVKAYPQGTFINYRHTTEDTDRCASMLASMFVLAKQLGGIAEQPTFLGPGFSHHEVGTLRMGLDPKNSATDRYGMLWGHPDLYAVDGSLFPCSGIANPLLTIAALAYWVCDHME